ncbi:MAG TPA: alkaline phosphatase D family protein [Gemmataceae bacterium]|nr:alkaline phosphatase D family protein [Gemmataceae bacterium]
MSLARSLSLALLVLIGLLPCAAVADDPAPRRIAFGSCAHQDKPQPIWDVVIAAKPDLFLFLGDTVYGDTTDMDVLRKKYAKLAAIPGWQRLRAACPVHATWDDHDYGANDAGAEYPKKDESQQIFLDFFGVAKDAPRRTQKGVYHAQLFGPPERRLQVILLDTRYFRSPLKKRGKFIPGEGPYIPSPDKTATMLGDAQWRWLEAQFRVPAKVRLLVSSIEVVAEDHGWEKWMNLPHERERLYQLIRDTKAGGVVVLSGDRHLGELSVMDAGIGYPLFDLTSSGLNWGEKKWRPLEVNRHRLATMNDGDNFGLVTIDWDRPDPLLSLQIRDVQGDVTIQQKVPLSLLQPGELKSKGIERARLASGELLTPEEVTKHLDKRRTIEMRVQATGTGGGLIFLNSSANFRGEENFTVVLDKAAQEKLRAAGVTAPRSHYQDQLIRVTGVLSLFRERPQIVVSDPAQIEIVKK